MPYNLNIVGKIVIVSINRRINFLQLDPPLVYRKDIKSTFFSIL